MMENLNEQRSFDTDGLLKSTMGNKRKWASVILCGVLFVSIILNLIFIFYFSKTRTAEIPGQPTFLLTSAQEQIITEERIGNVDDTKVLDQTHKVDKKVINDYGTIWLGIQATPSEGQVGPVTPNYELWRIGRNNERTLIENFSLGICDDINWSLNGKGGIDLFYMTSPCEAFVVNTKIIYDERGREQFRMQHNSSAGHFTFKQDGRPEYEVSLIVEGVCEGSAPQSPAEYSLPEVLLKGVMTKSSHRDEEKVYILNESKKISCGTGYGDAIVDPIIGNPAFDGEKIEFTLPNKQIAIIFLTPDRYAEVEFK